MTPLIMKTRRFDKMPYLLADRHHNLIFSVQIQFFSPWQLLYIVLPRFPRWHQAVCSVLSYSSLRGVHLLWQKVPAKKTWTRDHRKVLKEKVHDSCPSTYVIRMFTQRSLWWAEQVVDILTESKCMEGKPKQERSLGRPRHRWKYNIKMDGRLWTGLIWPNTRYEGNEDWISVLD